MPVYTTQADFEEYVEGWTTTDQAALLRLLDRAELDLDHSFFAFPQGTGLVSERRVDVTLLSDDDAAALNRAACAQAEYRNLMGEEFFVRAQWQAVTGPEFTTKGMLPIIGPKVYRELSNIRLMQRGARARPGRRAAAPAGFWGIGSVPYALPGRDI